jgi:hypothetical protein
MKKVIGNELHQLCCVLNLKLNVGGGKNAIIKLQ